MATNQAYDTFDRYVDSLGGVNDSNAREVYDYANRLKIGAGGVDKALEADPGASAKYIAEQGWDPLVGPNAPSSNRSGGNIGFGSATSGGFSSFQSTPTPATPAAPPQDLEPVREYTPINQEIDPTQTTAGLLTSLLDSENPYIKRARGRAMLNANSRGLLNSSIAGASAEAAAIDAAMPIAQQDAQIYQNQQLANQSYQNDAGKFNADSFNRRALEIMSNSTAIKVAGIGASATVQAASIGANSRIAVANISRQTALESLDKSLENELIRDAARSLDKRLENAQLQGYKEDDRVAELDDWKTKEEIKFKNNTLTGTMNGVSAYMSDPTLTPEQQEAGAKTTIDIANMGINNYGTYSAINPLEWNRS